MEKTCSLLAVLSAITYSVGMRCAKPDSSSKCLLFCQLYPGRVDTTVSRVERQFIGRSQLVVLKLSDECVMMFICHEGKAISQFTNIWCTSGLRHRGMGRSWSSCWQPQRRSCALYLRRVSRWLPPNHGVQTRLFWLDDLSCTIRRTGRDYAANNNTWAIANTVWIVSVDPEKHVRHYSGKTPPFYTKLNKVRYFLFVFH